MAKISRKIAEAQLASLQQLIAAFAYRGKAHPSKALQQVVYQAEQAYYERSDFDTVEHLAQVAACIVARERPIFKKDPAKWIAKIKDLHEIIRAVLVSEVAANWASGKLRNSIGETQCLKNANL